VNRDIILLPSLLLASGFECLDTQDVKFLNNYRKHLDKTKFDLEEIFMVTSSDFELGGIMNPFNLMDGTTSMYEECKNHFSSFPYLSRIDIKTKIYQNHLDQILINLINEIVTEISDLQKVQNPQILESISENGFNIRDIDQLKEQRLYQKTVSLHLCGYGNIILDAFNKVLKEYMKTLEIKEIVE